MRLTWYGHAAFLVEAEGRRIILDPYTAPDAGSYEPIDDQADLVVVSHENAKYHSGLSQIRPPFEVVRALEIPPEGAEAAGIRFFAIPVFETPEKKPGDEVTVVHFRADACPRRLPRRPRPRPDRRGSRADPRGRRVAASRPAARRRSTSRSIPDLIEAIAPKLIVPMHYLTPKINLKIQPVERFLDALQGWPVERVGGPTIEVGPAALGERRIVVLESAR